MKIPQKHFPLISVEIGKIQDGFSELGESKKGILSGCKKFLVDVAGKQRKWASVSGLSKDQRSFFADSQYTGRSGVKSKKNVPNRKWIWSRIPTGDHFPAVDSDLLRASR